MANISLEYPDITEERIYDYYTLIEDEDPAEEYSDLSACSNVEEAVSELHKIHSNYTHRVLVHFKEKSCGSAELSGFEMEFVLERGSLMGRVELGIKFGFRFC